MTRPVPLAHAEATPPAAILAIEPRTNPCHRCGRPATTQWRRNATDTEAEQHWAAVEQHIRSIPNLVDASNAEYVADRDQPVVKAVFGCDEHDLSPTPADAGKKATVAAKQVGADARALTHAADCGGHGACQCGGAA